MTFNHIVERTIFWLALALIATAAFSLTIGQALPIEFSNYRTRNQYYNFIFLSVPIAILLTLIGTIKKKHTRSKNWTIGILTVLSAVLSFFFLLGTIFSVAVGAWKDEAILYSYKNDSNVTIKHQNYDAGIFDVYERRTVKLTPFLKWFQIVEKVDTDKIDKTKWLPVSEESGIPLP